MKPSDHPKSATQPSEIFYCEPFKVALSGSACVARSRITKRGDLPVYPQCSTCPVGAEHIKLFGDKLGLPASVRPNAPPLPRPAVQGAQPPKSVPESLVAAFPKKKGGRPPKQPRIVTTETPKTIECPQPEPASEAPEEPEEPEPASTPNTPQQSPVHVDRSATADAEPIVRCKHCKGEYKITTGLRAMAAEYPGFDVWCSPCRAEVLYVRRKERRWLSWAVTEGLSGLLASFVDAPLGLDVVVPCARPTGAKLPISFEERVALHRRRNEMIGKCMAAFEHASKEEILDVLAHLTFVITDLWE